MFFSFMALDLRQIFCDFLFRALLRCEKRAIHPLRAVHLHGAASSSRPPSNFLHTLLLFLLFDALEVLRLFFHLLCPNPLICRVTTSPCRTVECAEASPKQDRFELFRAGISCPRFYTLCQRLLRLPLTLHPPQCLPTLPLLVRGVVVTVVYVTFSLVLL